MAGDTKLRPYYDPDTFNAGYSVIYKPGVGLIDTATQKEITSTFTFGNSSGKPNLLSGNVGLGASGASRVKVNRPDRLIPSSDINYINDLEISEYFDFNNLSELLKNLVWSFCTNYCRVLLTQPLDIVRLTLQVGYFDFSVKSKGGEKKESKGNGRLGGLDGVDDDEEIDFFQPTQTTHTTQLQPTQSQNSPGSPRKSKRRQSSGGKRRVSKNPHKIHPISQHTVDIMSAIASKDGPFALFRGVNASFIHYTLSHTIEAWITGFISPFLNIPDPFFLDLTHSTEPAKSLGLSVSACVLTGLILMPLDLIKVRFMITPFDKKSRGSDEAGSDEVGSHGSDKAVPEEIDSKKTPSVVSVSAVSEAAESLISVNTRSIRDSLRHYPTQLLLNPPPSITVLTILHQISTIVFRKSAPYFLFVRYNIDSYSSPNLFTTANLVLSITEFFVKLPVENLLRKEQVRFLLQPKSLEEDKHRVVTIDNPDENLLVDFNGWNSRHSDSDSDSDSEGSDDEHLSVWTKIKHLGLFKGWRVGVLNVIGFWGYNIVKSTSVMTEERL